MYGKQVLDPHSGPQLQLKAPPETQLPSTHASLTVQMFLSSHEPVRIVRVQTPVAGSQASSVHGLPSSQFSGVWTQSPVIGSHVSAVQGLPSSQSSGSWRQVPAVVSHESTVQLSKSSQDGQLICGAIVAARGSWDGRTTIDRARVSAPMLVFMGSAPPGKAPSEVHFSWVRLLPGKPRQRSTVSLRDRLSKPLYTPSP